MIRNLKALGLAAFALFAFAAMAAPAVQAQEATLTTGTTGEPDHHTATDLHAVQLDGPNLTTNVFIVPGLPQVTCTNSTTSFSGSSDGTEEHVVMDPNYKHCATVTENHTIGAPVTVTDNGCDFTFDQPETITDTDTYTGTVDVTCPAEATIEVEVYASGTYTSHSLKVCTLRVGEQENISHVVYENDDSGSLDDIFVEVTGEGIEWSKGGLCGAGEGANATYNSHLTLTSDEDDVWISD